MQYAVNITAKDSSNTIDSGDCSDSNTDIQHWIQIAQQHADSLGKTIVVSFKPKEVIFEIEPKGEIIP